MARVTEMNPGGRIRHKRTFTVQLDAPNDTLGAAVAALRLPLKRETEADERRMVLVVKIKERTAKSTKYGIEVEYERSQPAGKA